MNDYENGDIERGETKKNGKLLGIGLAVVLALAAFFSGLHIGSGGSIKSPMEAGLFTFFSSLAEPNEEANLNEFWRVWNLLEKKFVSSTSTNSVSVSDRLNGAIEGLVGSYGDPYTLFLPPEDAAEFEDDIGGQFSGVGMEVGLRGGLITVIAPLSDSPSEKAGIVAGDVIVKIDGTATDGMTIEEAVRLIRGEVGSQVVLTVYREGELEFKDISITRDVITIPTVDTEVKKGVYIIRLYNFNALAETKVQDALDNYRRRGYEKLVLDLRGNPGGYLQSAVAIAGYFLPTGSVVLREHFGDGIEEQVYRSQGKSVANFNPDNFVILIDGGSASASEILAGALSEQKIATTIGTKTFGKGSVQELIKLPSGASLKVTVARWLTPNGISLSEDGLEPMVKISRTPQQVVADEDPQEEAALLWLSGDHSIGEKDAISLLQ